MAVDLDLWLRDLGARLGLEDLRLDESRSCIIQTEAFEVTIEEDVDAGAVILYAKVGDLPGDASADYYARLLEANFFTRETAGATLGIDQNLGLVVAYLRLSLHELTPQNFEDRLMAFFEVVDYWAAELASAEAEAEMSDVENSSSDGSKEAVLGDSRLMLNALRG